MSSRSPLSAAGGSFSDAEEDIKRADPSPSMTWVLLKTGISPPGLFAKPRRVFDSLLGWHGVRHGQRTRFFFVWDPELPVEGATGPAAAPTEIMPCTLIHLAGYRFFENIAHKAGCSVSFRRIRAAFPLRQ